MFPEVNPAAESTWKNHPKPGEFAEFERELLSIGGRHVTGHTMLRLQWAPEFYKFQLGRPRPYFVDTRIPTRKRLTRIYYQVKSLVDPFAPWQTVELDELGKYPGVAYLHVVRHDKEVVTISRQQWAVMQYFPPEMLRETPEQWNARRYRMFTPPETNLPIFGDDIGPFPSEGEYRLVFFIEGRREYSYTPPCREALEVVRAAWAHRESYHRSVSREKQVENDYEAAEERERTLIAERDAQLDEELKPYVRRDEGNAFVSVPEMPG
jgi:hypothetical protein